MIRIDLTSFTDGAGGTLARVAATVGSSGPTSNTTQIVIADFGAANPPNGGSTPFFNNRILAHKMTQAVRDAT